MVGEGTCLYSGAQISRLYAKELSSLSMVAFGTVAQFISKCRSQIAPSGHGESERTCNEIAVLPDCCGQMGGR